MAMTAKVENYCMQHTFGTKSICRNRGNVATWVPTHIGFCLLREKQCGALGQPCRDFETKERS